MTYLSENAINELKKKKLITSKDFPNKLQSGLRTTLEGHNLVS